MNICIIGEGLTSLSLAKSLIKKKINIHIFHENKISKILSNRTIGISKDNFDFFRKEILKIPKSNYWEINKININSDKLEGQNLLKFEDNQKNLFYMVKNHELYKILKREILKDNYIKFKKIRKKNFYDTVLKNEKYDLIINCISNNNFSKKYFEKKIDKDYKNLAYTTILNHTKLKNKTAVQTFTKVGPIAFLPISNTQTSVVCSLDVRKRTYVDKDVIRLIYKNNPGYKIKKILKLNSFKLSFINLRNYRYKKILAFGDLIHKIHPLAGQGFNMSLRDIRALSEIIQNKINLGIELNTSVLEEFEKKTKSRNFLFSNGIDFIYEIFNVDKKINNKILSKTLKIIGGNKMFTNYLIKLADKGLNL